ncbi:histidine phosphatase family protein [Labedaea rhizosphaerae]|uniref:Putative phosphoglycerate mutase n=1 Tax=Labedaea rhizosphaerae TaxID=598644 RepID=A0A4V3CYD7_LABRH|nr:histidine phosphatase family protein [Labedaea rhizosphaerae]TDP93758.1 putative phosphoglycerate mutase [Labedaea rhizosphaerae]
MAGEGKTGIYLLRHGQTEWSRDGRHTGRSDIPLTPEGEELARAAGRTLAGLRGGAAPALVLSSPRQRAVRTAELAGLTVDEQTEDLAEWDYGDYEGRTTPQIRESVPGWTVWTHPTPNGETAEQVGARARAVLDRVRPALADGDVVLIGHGHFSRVLVAAWLELPATKGVSFGMDAAAVSVLGDERGAPQIQHLNVPAGATA